MHTFSMYVEAFRCTSGVYIADMFLRRCIVPKRLSRTLLIRSAEAYTSSGPKPLMIILKLVQTEKSILNVVNSNQIMIVISPFQLI